MAPDAARWLEALGRAARAHPLGRAMDGALAQRVALQQLGPKGRRVLGLHPSEATDCRLHPPGGAVRGSLGNSRAPHRRPPPSRVWSAELEAVSQHSLPSVAASLGQDGEGP